MVLKVVTFVTDIFVFAPYVFPVHPMTLTLTPFVILYALKNVQFSYISVFAYSLSVCYQIKRGTQIAACDHVHKVDHVLVSCSNGLIRLAS